MMDSCPAFGSSSGYVPELLTLIDCRSGEFARQGFGAFAASGSPAQILIGGMLTLLIAFFGYRLLLGGKLDLNETVFAVVKIGIVLAFATQWPAYQAVFYDMALKGPQELIAALPFAKGDETARFPGRFQAAYDQLASFEAPSHIASISSVPSHIATPPPPSDPYAGAQIHALNEVSYGSFLAFRPMSAGLFLLVGPMVALALPRLVAGLMLALGPLFLGFLLFDVTRSIFTGWIRTLAWSVVAAAISTAILSIELSIIEPQVASLAGDIATGQSILSSLGECLATTFLFTILLLGGLVAAIAPTRLAISSFRNFRRVALLEQFSKSGFSGFESRPGPTFRQDVHRSRAQEVADHMARRSTIEDAPSDRRTLQSLGQRENLGEPRAQSDIAPLGQSYRPSASSRRPLSPTRRRLGS